MSLHYRQRYQLHLIETRLRRSDPRLAGMLGIFGRLSAGQAMPFWEQMSSSKDGIRQAAALLAEAVTIVAAAFRVLLSAVLTFAAATCGDRARPLDLRRGRTRRPAPRRGRVWSLVPKRDRADPGRRAGGWPDPAGSS